METLEDLLISRAELDRITTGQTALYLWRSLHKGSTSTNPLYPDFEAREVRGVLRAPDVEVRTIHGVQCVISRLGDGTSLFDRPDTFGTKHWTYFEIPKGTVIPPGLIIVKDSFNQKYKATHYSLSPNTTMPKSHFVALLDTLAKNAIERSQKVGHGGA